MVHVSSFATMNVKRYGMSTMTGFTRVVALGALGCFVGERTEEWRRGVLLEREQRSGESTTLIVTQTAAEELNEFLVNE